MSILLWLVVVLSGLTQTVEYKVCTYDWHCATALRVFDCESWLGRHPDAHDTTQPNAGIAQINRATWEDWMLENYGWTWEQITYDDDVNLSAAYIVYTEHERVFKEIGWEAWDCYSLATTS